VVRRAVWWQPSHEAEVAGDAGIGPSLMRDIVVMTGVPASFFFKGLASALSEAA
jgi:hypothetical protein